MCGGGTANRCPSRWGSDWGLAGAVGGWPGDAGWRQCSTRVYPPGCTDYALFCPSRSLYSIPLSGATNPLAQHGPRPLAALIVRCHCSTYLLPVPGRDDDGTQAHLGPGQGP